MLNSLFPKPSTPKDLPLRAPLPLPVGYNEQSLFEYLHGFHVVGSPATELRSYVDQDFRRFVYTLGLLPAQQGRVLEIGANPYFTSVLIRKFTECEHFATNFFGEQYPPEGRQTVSNNERKESFEFRFVNHNIEHQNLPFDAEFDAVLFCEVIEHLLLDPLAALLRINRVLKPQGHLILTTPNVARLENVARIISGVNIYDPYSGHGPYGRHNREFNRHELVHLLRHAGFEIEAFFTSDVHPNDTATHFDLTSVIPLVRYREADLGQYLFCRARRVSAGERRKPKWLYRSYPPEELVDTPI